MNLRLIAAQIIDEVTNGRSLSDVLPTYFQSIKDPRDRAFVQALCYGVCRYYPRLDVILSYLLQKPMREKDSDVHALLLVGLYQLMEMRVPAHAAVSETVSAVEKFKKPWARGLINAVLREYLRNKDKIDAEMMTDDEAIYAHPSWWIHAIKKAWPDQWEQILSANNAHPPFSLRVNLQRADRDTYLHRIENEAQIIPETKTGILLASPISVDMLPGFADGDISVQDGAAQLAAELLQLEPEQLVLDACAAPGGKLMHMLEIQPQLEVVAIEKDPKRIESIRENLIRLKSQADCICRDANEVESWWDGRLFDRILLDAPCSASGVIRRHPDIKLLRQPTDLKNLAKEQAKLLDSLWPLLTSGGLFVYVTCSIFPEENILQMQHFIDRHPDALEEKIRADWGIACDIGRQILPGMHEMDGFYYACFRKM
ncbi:MAG: hypothetical protein ACD_46C00478G0007 [uncultured bacterium]|nr:MAG: hypothetical protein ACD_46C00478G0007 [uncultured bacterium]